MSFEQIPINIEALTEELDSIIDQMEANDLIAPFGDEELKENYALLQIADTIVRKLESAGYETKLINKYTEKCNSVREFLAKMEDELERRAA